MFVECGDLDTAVVTLMFPGGAVAQIEMSRYTHSSHYQRVEVLDICRLTATRDVIDLNSFTLLSFISRM